MLYTAFQNKMHDNLYCTYSNYHPKLIMSHTKANNAINYFPVCPRDTFKYT